MTRDGAVVDADVLGADPSTAAPGDRGTGPGPSIEAAIRSLARGTRANVIGTIVERAAGFGLVIVLAVILSPADLGTFYEVAAVVAVLTTIGVIGLDVGVVRATSAALARGDAGDVGRCRAIALAVSAAMSGCLAALLWFAAPAIGERLAQPGMSGPIRIACIAIPLLAATAILVAPARGLKRMLPTVLAIQVTQPVVQLAAAYLLLRAEPSPSGAVWALVFAAAAGWGVAVLMAARTRVEGPSARSEAVEPVAGPLLRFSVPVCLSALIDSGLLWVDALILGMYRPAADVATYGLVVRFMTLSFAAVLTVTAIFGPFVAQFIERHDRQGLERVLRTATRWAALIACPVIVASVVFGPAILTLLGQEGEAARPAIAILSLAFLVDAFTGPVGNVLTMSGRSSLNLANNVVALVANVALDLVLVPLFGIAGAAAGWAVVIVGVNVARVVQVRMLVGVSPFGAMAWKPLAAGLAAAVAGGATLQSVGASLAGVALGLSMFGAMYLAACALLGLNGDDAAVLRGLREPNRGPDRRLAGSLGDRVGWLRPAAGWALAALVALALGAGVGTGSKAGPIAVIAVAACFGALLAPMPWLIYGSLICALLYRVAAPTSSGWVSYVPDALLALVVVRVAVDLSLGRAGATAGTMLRRLRIPLIVFVAVALVSWLAHGAGLGPLAGSLREFVRFPLWAFALAAWGIGWTEVKRMVWIVLSVSLLQLPAALYETHHPIAAAALLPGVHFYAGDTITGTFGLAGSNTAMVFLVLAALVWVALVVSRAIPAWTLWVAAPAIVLPMALGSAALFVALLPAAIIALLCRAAVVRGTRVTAGVVLGGLVVLLLVAVGARSLGSAPGLGSGPQGTALSILSGAYVGSYVDATSNAGPTTRLGFLGLAVGATMHDGPRHALLGLGPRYAVIGGDPVQVGPTSIGVLATASVQSVPRMLLGFGLLGLLAYLAVLVAPAVAVWSSRPVEPIARALVLMLPIATAVYVVAGVYNAAWTDPGISVAYWTLALAASVGAATVRAERAIDVRRIAA